MLMLTTLAQDLEMVSRAILACMLGGIIGWERERHRHIISAGIRTYGAIALGSCMFGVIGLFAGGGDATRIAAQVVTGIGFLGGGIIFRHGDDISGLTTAATLWATASVGLAIAFGYYIAGVVVALLIYLLLYLARLPVWKKISPKLAKLPPA